MTLDGADLKGEGCEPVSPVALDKRVMDLAGRVLGASGGSIAQCP